MTFPTIQSPEQLRHHEACTSTRVRTFLGDRGDRIARCKDCRHLAILEPAPPVVVPILEVGRDAVSTRLGLPARPTWTPYRCRLHNDVMVDRHGRGCPQCDASRRGGR